MSRIFLGFCIGPLHVPVFGFELVEIFLIEKRLPNSRSRGVDKIAYEYNFFQTFKKINGDSTLHPWLLFCLLDLVKGWFSRLKFRKI
jgi:hypothetical protein